MWREAVRISHRVSAIDWCNRALDNVDHQFTEADGKAAHRPGKVTVARSKQLIHSPQPLRPTSRLCIILQGTVAFVGSHLDVVPADPETWERDPFKLTVEGDKLYGARGVLASCGWA